MTPVSNSRGSANACRLDPHHFAVAGAILDHSPVKGAAALPATRAIGPGRKPSLSGSSPDREAGLHLADSRNRIGLWRSVPWVPTWAPTPVGRPITPSSIRRRTVCRRPPKTLSGALPTRTPPAVPLQEGAPVVDIGDKRLFRIDMFTGLNGPQRDIGMAAGIVRFRTQSISGSDRMSQPCRPAGCVPDSLGLTFFHIKACTGDDIQPLEPRAIE